MRKKKMFEYHDNLIMKIELTLVGTALEIEKFRRLVLSINSNLDSVSVSRAKIVQKNDGETT